MKKFFEFLGVIAVSLVAGAYLHKCQDAQSPHPPELPGDVVVDTIPYYVTIPYYLPEPKQEVSLGAKTIFLPVSIPRPADSAPCDKPAYAEGDSAPCGKPAYAGEATASNRKDSVAVEIPITQREYEAEEYHAWVSGYDPKIDSIYVFPRREVVTVRERGRQKRWGVGVFAGYGYTPHGFQPCVGVSVSYNLWNF